MHSHLKLAHSYWGRHLKAGDHVIDATCGNGHDSLVLARKIASCGKGKLHCLDIQEKALQSTRKLLEEHLEPSGFKNISLYQACHSQFPPACLEKPLKLIVYNLGYLPGGDKTITSKCTTTLDSISLALSYICPNNGMISIMTYPGHEEGAKEHSALLKFISCLPSDLYTACLHSWPNRSLSPHLIVINNNKH